MSDLIQEYLKRDLSEAEEQQLSELLASSSGEASRFAGEMAKLYGEFGLPEPLWPGKPMPSLGKGNSISKLEIVFLGLCVLCLIGFVLRERWIGKSETALPAAMGTEPAARSIPQPDFHPKKTHARKIQVAPERSLQPVVQPVPPLEKLSAPRPETVLTTQPPPAALTSPSQTGRLYERLSVNVNLPQSGWVTVRVFDQGNNLIRSVFEGGLEAGLQVFTWDGKLEGGQIAPPGNYDLEVGFGGRTIRKKVKVGADANP